MSTVLAPNDIAEVVEAVRATEHLLAIGAQTKPRLSAVEDQFARLSMRGFRGVVEYQPDEYTITALAGTSLAEITATLNEHEQYLPFDPALIEAGATLGGSVAAGLNGPGRVRFGGCRDFILAIQMVDGLGRLLRLGAKVVKNAAGFDVPKFLVGSLGRFGVITEATFKVFPRPRASTTLQFQTRDVSSALKILSEIGRGRWEADALDLLPRDGTACVRLAAPSEALSSLVRDLLGRWPGEELAADAAENLWVELRERTWAHPSGCLFKVPCTPVAVPALWDIARKLEDGRAHVSAGGQVVFISLPASAEVGALDKGLTKSGLTALTLQGEAPLWLGVRPEHAIAERVKNAFDPHHRFPSLEN